MPKKKKVESVEVIAKKETLPKKEIKVSTIVEESAPQLKVFLPLGFEQYIGHPDQEMYVWLALHLIRVDPATELKNSLVQYNQLVGNEEKLNEYVEFSNKLVEALNRDEKTLLPNLAKFLYSTDIQFDKIEDCTLILSRRSDLSPEIVEALEEFKEKCLRLE